MDTDKHDDSAMEHPVVFFETLVSESPVFDALHSLRDALARELGDDPARMALYDDALRRLELRARTLDWLADRSRRAVFGDLEAEAMLGSCLDSLPEMTGEPSPVGPVSGPNDPVLDCLMPPYLDVLMGTSYASHDDPHVLQRRAVKVRAAFAMMASELDFAASMTARYQRGAESAEAFALALGECGVGTDILHQRKHSREDQRDPVVQLYERWVARNPVSVWLTYSIEQRNNSAIVQLSPMAVRGGDEVTLHAAEANSFDATRPDRIEVVVGPLGSAAGVSRWSATEITVRVPDDADSGCVYFARTPTEDESRKVESLMHQFEKLMGMWWHDCFLGHHSPVAFARKPRCHHDGRNRLHVLHKPTILSFNALDNKGRVLPGPVDAGTTITLGWVVVSGDPAAPEVSISANGRPAFTDLRTSGRLRVPITKTVTFVLQAGLVGDLASAEVVVTAGGPMLRLSPTPLTASRTRTDTLRVELPYPNPTQDVTVTFTSSDDAKVVVWPAATIPAGATGAETIVRGLVEGQIPGSPAAAITASAPGYLSVSVPVWLENPRGRWTEIQTALDLVPVHAALMRNGRILFFSWDEDDYKDLKKGKSQVWDPTTQVPGPLLNLRWNLFCAGHCFLPDGRLMVAGGKNGGPYFPIPLFPFPTYIAHEGPDRDLHTVEIDDQQPSGVRWDTHEAFREARWYPTCVTLADGRGLTVGGSRSGSGQAYINLTYEVFEPIGGEKSDPIPFGKDAKVYPFLMLLPDGTPEGTLFVHRKHSTYLRRLATNDWVGKTFHTVLRKSRTYNRQGTCVLLPLRPDSPVRLLVVGGDGGDNAATNTAEIFEFDPVQPKNSKWRSTASHKFKRFMSDAILLPDGTVLVVNGAARGAADSSHGSVKTAELFHPAAEVWETLAPAQHSRHYHSVGLLLADATVLTAGNTRPYNPGNPIDERTVEIFTPPYLFRGPQPTITGAPAQVGHNEDLVVVSPDMAHPDKDGEIANPNWIASAVFVRASSVTHSNNMDQRHVEAAIVRRDSRTLTVRSPADGTVAPPGYYMIFLVNRNGVPSKGRFIRIG